MVMLIGINSFLSVHVASQCFTLFIHIDVLDIKKIA